MFFSLSPHFCFAIMCARSRRATAAAAALLLAGLARAADAPPFSLDALGAFADTVPGLPSPVPLERSPLPRNSLLGYPEGAKFPLSGKRVCVCAARRRRAW